MKQFVGARISDSYYLKNMKQDIIPTGATLIAHLSKMYIIGTDLTFNNFVSREDTDAEAWWHSHGALYLQQTPVPRMFSGH